MPDNRPQCDFCTVKKGFYKPATCRVSYLLSNVAWLSPGEKDVRCERNACDECAENAAYEKIEMRPV